MIYSVLGAFKGVHCLFFSAKGCRSLLNVNQGQAYLVSKCLFSASKILIEEMKFRVNTQAGLA
jgi:hypothetical protein